MIDERWSPKCDAAPRPRFQRAFPPPQLSTRPRSDFRLAADPRRLLLSCKCRGGSLGAKDAEADGEASNRCYHQDSAAGFWRLSDRYFCCARQGQQRRRQADTYHRLLPLL